MKLGLLRAYFVAENDIQPFIWTRDRWVQPGPGFRFRGSSRSHAWTPMSRGHTSHFTTRQTLHSTQL